MYGLINSLPIKIKQLKKNSHLSKILFYVISQNEDK